MTNIALFLIYSAVSQRTISVAVIYFLKKHLRLFMYQHGESVSDLCPGICTGERERLGIFSGDL